MEDEKTCENCLFWDNIPQANKGYCEAAQTNNDMFCVKINDPLTYKPVLVTNKDFFCKEHELKSEKKGITFLQDFKIKKSVNGTDFVVHPEKNTPKSKPKSNEKYHESMRNDEIIELNSELHKVRKIKYKGKIYISIDAF